MNPGEVVVYKCKGMFKVEDVGTLNFSFVDRRKKVLYPAVFGGFKRAGICADRR